MGTLSSKSFQSKWKLGVRLSYESILLLKNPCIVNANINIKPGMYSENFNWPTDHHLDSEGFELQHKNKLKEYSKIFPRTTSLQFWYYYASVLKSLYQSHNDLNLIFYIYLFLYLRSANIVSCFIVQHHHTCIFIVKSR